MNIHQAKRIDRCKEITFALKRIGWLISRSHCLFLAEQSILYHIPNRQDPMDDSGPARERHDRRKSDRSQKSSVYPQKHLKGDI